MVFEKLDFEILKFYKKIPGCLIRFANQTEPRMPLL